MSATLHECSRMKHELSINIYESFMVIHGHLCNAVGNGHISYHYHESFMLVLIVNALHAVADSGEHLVGDGLEDVAEDGDG